MRFSKCFCTFFHELKPKIEIDCRFWFKKKIVHNKMCIVAYYIYFKATDPKSITRKRMEQQSVAMVIRIAYAAHCNCSSKHCTLPQTTWSATNKFIFSGSRQIQIPIFFALWWRHAKISQNQMWNIYAQSSNERTYNVKWGDWAQNWPKMFQLTDTEQSMYGSSAFYLVQVHTNAFIAGNNFLLLKFTWIYNLTFNKFESICMFQCAIYIR